jgi:hypothetical protein
MFYNQNRRIDPRQITVGFSRFKVAFDLGEPSKPLNDWWTVRGTAICH